MFNLLLILLDVLTLAFLVWRILSLDSFRLDATKRLNHAEARITDLYRRHDMAPVNLGSDLCGLCNKALPENSVKTHDGHWLCAECKAFGAIK